MNSVCPKCGKPVAYGSPSCGSCGLLFSYAAPTQPRVASNERIALYGLGVLLAFVLVLVAWNQLRLADDRAQIDRVVNEQKQRAEAANQRNGGDPWNNIYRDTHPPADNNSIPSP